MRRDQAIVGDFETMLISTHAPRVRRDESGYTDVWSKKISTHAPRVRRDSALVS